MSLGIQFEDLYHQHSAQVRRTAYSLSGPQDLDDIVQETFLRLWRSLEAFRGDSDPKTWVYRVTVNTAREHWRKAGRRRNAMLRYLEEPRPRDAPALQERWELDRWVAAALQELDWEHREAVTLCYLEDLSVAEIAKIAGIPEGTVKSRLYHARLRLNALLQGKEPAHGRR